MCVFARLAIVGQLRLIRFCIIIGSNREPLSISPARPDSIKQLAWAVESREGMLAWQASAGAEWAVAAAKARPDPEERGPSGMQRAQPTSLDLIQRQSRQNAPARGGAFCSVRALLAPRRPHRRPGCDGTRLALDQALAQRGQLRGDALLNPDWRRDVAAVQRLVAPVVHVAEQAAGIRLDIIHAKPGQQLDRRVTVQLATLRAAAEVLDPGGELRGCHDAHDWRSQ
jgi:hypothetical protein